MACFLNFSLSHSLSLFFLNSVKGCPGAVGRMQLLHSQTVQGKPEGHFGKSQQHVNMGRVRFRFSNYGNNEYHDLTVQILRLKAVCFVMGWLVYSKILALRLPLMV